MLESLTIDHFAGRLGERFTIALDHGNEVETALLEATPLYPRRESESRKQFSIVFRGPYEPVLPQRIYPLRRKGR